MCIRDRSQGMNMKQERLFSSENSFTRKTSLGFSWCIWSYCDLPRCAFKNEEDTPLTWVERLPGVFPKCDLSSLPYSLQYVRWFKRAIHNVWKGREEKTKRIWLHWSLVPQLRNASSVKTMVTMCCPCHFSWMSFGVEDRGGRVEKNLHIFHHHLVPFNTRERSIK